MRGARPLANNEILLVAKQFYGTFAIRNRSLFMLGVSVGGRISEMLALTIGDVWQNGRPVKDLLFLRGIVKGREASRMIPVNADGQRAILDLVTWHGHKFGDLVPDSPLFVSRKFGNAMSRGQAHKVLEGAFIKAGLNGKLATHSLRKSFAQRAYDASGDIYLVQQLLGHKDVSTTREYLGVSYEKMKQTLLAIETSKGECDTSRVLLHSHNDNKSLISEIQRQNQIIDRLTRMLDRDKQQPIVEAVSDDDKVIPIDVVRRARGR